MKQQSMFCPNCGTEGHGKFCGKCGHKLAQEMAPPKVNPPIQPMNPADQPRGVIQPLRQPEKRSGMGKGCLISLTLLVIFVLLSGFIFAQIFSRIFHELSNNLWGCFYIGIGDWL